MQDSLATVVEESNRLASPLALARQKIDEATPVNTILSGDPLYERSALVDHWLLLDLFERPSQANEHFECLADGGICGVEQELLRYATPKRLECRHVGDIRNTASRIS